MPNLRISDRRKKILGRTLHWCLVWVWRFNVSSLQNHAPIYRISICALEKKKFKHFDVERPMKVCALTSLSRAPAAAETIARTKLAELRFHMTHKKKSEAFPMKHRPCPSCTDVQVDVSTKNILSEKIQTYLDLVWLFQNRYSFQWRNLAAQYVFNPIVNKACPIAVKYYTTTCTGAIFFFDRLGGCAKHNFARAKQNPHECQINSVILKP